MKIGASNSFQIEEVSDEETELLDPSLGDVDEVLDISSEKSEEVEGKLTSSKVVHLSSSAAPNSNPSTTINNLISMRQSDELNRVRRQLDRTSDKVNELQQEIARLKKDNERLNDEVKEKTEQNLRLEEILLESTQENDDIINETVNRVHAERVEESRWSKIKTWITGGAALVAVAALAAGIAALVLQIIRAAA